MGGGEVTMKRQCRDTFHAAARPKAKMTEPIFRMRVWLKCHTGGSGQAQETRIAIKTESHERKFA
jgi:hypothetical protein